MPANVYDNVKSVLALPAKSITTTTTGSAVDTLGYENAKLSINLGVLDITTGDETYVLTITECATSGGSFVDTGLVLPAIVGGTANNSVVVQRVSGLGTTRLRYLKVVATLAGTTPIFVGSATWEFGRALQNPV